jgi:hypothetical protein
MRDASPHERGAVGRRGLHVPANDGGSPLIRTSEYIANSILAFYHGWTPRLLVPDLRFHGWPGLVVTGPS